MTVLISMSVHTWFKLPKLEDTALKRRQWFRVARTIRGFLFSEVKVAANAARYSREFCWTSSFLQAGGKKARDGETVVPRYAYGYTRWGRA